jgi:anthranilate synthase component 1
MTYTFKTKIHKTLCDTHTPVEMYLKLRDRYPNSFLLESSDYKSRENSFSYLCLHPIASFHADTKHVQVRYPDGRRIVRSTLASDVTEAMNQFAGSFVTEDLQLEFATSGLFGYTSYNAVSLFEDIHLNQVANPDSPDSYRDRAHPLIQYHLFRYIIIFNHFNNELYFSELVGENEKSSMYDLLGLLANRSIPRFSFSTNGEETSNLTDEEFLEIVEKGKVHCHRGDVFQVVLSRKFRQGFRGDEFNVYRALRSVNPSPYLFYFDYGHFKLFGSSPEAQLTVAGNQAFIHPIAGTFRRTGDRTQDEVLAEALRHDPKENAEHVMLVDLARNDLSRHSQDVVVDKFREIEYYSHVIHMVSAVRATLDSGHNPMRILGDTFPAGTLTGAPKFRAMEIIDDLEHGSRGFYGGAIGFFSLHGKVNHAIFIRSFVSQNNALHYQAGAGVVAMSVATRELEEVKNKLGALRKAIGLAQSLSTTLA